MDKKQAIELAKRYKELISRHFKIKSLYLYGSYSKGNYKQESDIDIAVIVDDMDSDYFEVTPLLWKLRRQVSNLIEPVMLTAEPSNPLYSDIVSTGILI